MFMRVKKKEGFFMKTKMTAKKITAGLLALLMCMLMTLSFSACSESNAEVPSESQIQSATEKSTVDEYDVVWTDAVYTADTVMGEGNTTFYFEVKVGTHSVTFTVNTDETIVGKALLNNGIIAGDDGPYGLYVKTVNGIYADYDVNSTYWGFYQDGEYAMNGVDKTEIESGAHYEMVYSK